MTINHRTWANAWVQAVFSWPMWLKSKYILAAYFDGSLKSFPRNRIGSRSEGLKRMRVSRALSASWVMTRVHWWLGFDWRTGRTGNKRTGSLLFRKSTYFLSCYDWLKKLLTFILLSAMSHMKIVRSKF